MKFTFSQAWFEKAVELEAGQNVGAINPDLLSFPLDLTTGRLTYSFSVGEYRVEMLARHFHRRGIAKMKRALQQTIKYARPNIARNRRKFSKWVRAFEKLVVSYTRCKNGHA